MRFFKHPALIRLWLADALSKAGSSITRVALPLIAVLVLTATPPTNEKRVMRLRVHRCGTFTPAGTNR